MAEYEMPTMYFFNDFEHISGSLVVRFFGDNMVWMWATD